MHVLHHGGSNTYPNQVLRCATVHVRSGGTPSRKAVMVRRYVVVVVGGRPASQRFTRATSLEAPLRSTCAGGATNAFLPQEDVPARVRTRYLRRRAGGNKVLDAPTPQEPGARVR